MSEPIRQHFSNPPDSTSAAHQRVRQSVNPSISQTAEPIGWSSAPLSKLLSLPITRQLPRQPTSQPARAPPFSMAVVVSAAFALHTPRPWPQPWPQPYNQGPNTSKYPRTGGYWQDVRLGLQTTSSNIVEHGISSHTPPSRSTFTQVMCR